jgi:hypothetical protein
MYFGPREMTHLTTRGSSLLVHGAQLEPVSSLSDGSIEDMINDGRMVAYISDLIWRCPVYV